MLQGMETHWEEGPGSLHDRVEQSLNPRGTAVSQRRNISDWIRPPPTVSLPCSIRGVCIGGDPCRRNLKPLLQAQLPVRSGSASAEWIRLASVC